MVRKQIYIEERQESLLKRQARIRHASEAELIREAIDLQLGGRSATSTCDDGAWREAMNFIEGMPPAPSQGRWTREDLYEERLSRLDTRSH